MTEVYRIAEHNIGIESQFPVVHRFCAAYRTEGVPELTLSVTAEELEEDQRSLRAASPSEAEPWRFTPEYSALSLLYKKLAERLPFWNMVVLHGSAIAVDGQCYVFCAKSGTGKSTHTRLWRELLGARAFMVNDDKPILHIFPDGSAEVYGTPWDGKHRLSTDTHVPLKAICLLERSEINTIRQISKRDAYPMLLQQFYRPYDPAAMEKSLDLVDRLDVKLYRLGCNMEPGAAELSYQTMKG